MEFLDELNKCNNLLKKKARYEEFGLAEPLIVINPDLTDQFMLDFELKLFKSILAYEYNCGEHLWAIDMTSCLAKLRSSVSKFSLASGSKIYYVLKSNKGKGITGEQVSESPFSRTDHVLEVPSSVAIDSLQGLAKSKMNALIVMNYFEQGAFNQNNENDSIEDFLFGSQGSDNNQGLTFSDISQFAITLSERLEREIKVEQNQTRLATDLISNQLVSKINDVGKSRYVLTELGQFVANWAMQDSGLGLE